jgi:hypothetical protein
LGVFVSAFNIVEFMWRDRRVFPLGRCVKDEFAEVLFEVGDTVEEVDAGKDAKGA